MIIVLLVVLRPHFHGGYEDGTSSTPTRSRSSSATFVQLVMASARSGGSTSACSSRIDWHDPRVRQVFMLMLPVTIGLGIVNLDQLINSVFGTLVYKEAPRRDRQRVPHLHAARRGCSAWRSPPCCSRRSAAWPPAATRAAMRRAVGIGMRQINLLLIPAAAFMIVLATPIVRLRVRTRRSSTPQSTHLVVDRAVLVRLQPALRRASTCCSRARSSRCSGRGSPRSLAAHEHRRGHHREHRPVQAARDRGADHRHGRRPTR